MSREVLNKYRNSYYNKTKQRGARVRTLVNPVLPDKLAINFKNLRTTGVTTYSLYYKETRASASNLRTREEFNVFTGVLVTLVKHVYDNKKLAHNLIDLAFDYLSVDSRNAFLKSLLTTELLFAGFDLKEVKKYLKELHLKVLSLENTKINFIKDGFDFETELIFKNLKQEEKVFKVVEDKPIGAKQKERKVLLETEK